MQTERTRNKFYRFITRPRTGFIGYLLVVAFVIFVPRQGPNLIIFYLVLPWLMFAVLALNMGFITSVFHRFTFSEAVKRNHALEHGTIFFLRRRYGGKIKVGGCAAPDGFRICGIPKKEYLVTAFEDLLKELKRGHSELIVDMQCGTNDSTAQGLGIMLLSVTAIILLISGAGNMISLAALTANILLYFLLRTRLGNWVQGRFYLSLDFSDAKIKSIYRVEKKKYFWERNPVFFVKTDIS